MSRLRHRLFQPLRLVALVVLAACLLLQPALSAVGQVHDAFEHVGDAAQHHEAPASHAGEEGDGNDAMHLLLHYAHCCATTSAVFPVGPRLALLVGSVDMPALADARGHAQSRPGHPFRPPIAA